MRVSMAMAAVMVAMWMGACSGTGGGRPAAQEPSAGAAQDPPPVAGSPSESGTIDAPPADIRKEGEIVRCLVDSPDGCEGCDKGDTCVYQEMSSYDCVYVLYGTACTE